MFLILFIDEGDMPLKKFKFSDEFISRLCELGGVRTW